MMEEQPLKVKKLFIAIIALTMILMTINGATATTNITINPSSYFLRINNDTIATFNGTQTLIYIDSNGITDIINTSPYNAQRFIDWGVTPQPETIFDPEDLFFINPETQELVTADRNTQSINTYNLSGLLPSPLYLNRVRLIAIVQPLNTLLISYQPGSSYNIYWAKIEGLSNYTSIPLLGGCLQGATFYTGITCGTASVTCAKTFIDYNGTGYDLWTGEYRRCSSDTTFLQRRYHYDSAGTLTAIDANPVIRGYGWDNDAITTNPRPNFCYEDDDNIYCSRGYSPTNYFLVDKYNMSSSGTIGSVAYGNQTIYPIFADSNEENTLYIDNNSNLRLAIGGTLTNLSIPVTKKEQFDHAIMEEALIYHEGTGSNFVFIPLTEINNYTAPTPTDNYNNITTIKTYNLTGLTSIELIGNNNSVIGRNKELIIYNYDNPEIINEQDSVTIGEDIYKTSKNTNNIMVGTSNGIYTYDEATLTQQYNDKWGFLHPDNAYSVKTTSDTTAWVCDNHNEPDYYSAGSDPIGNLGTGCYDLSFDEAELYLLVDAGDNGIISIDISNSTNPSIEDNLDLITNRYDQDYGDLLDYLDDADQDLLLAITGYLTFATIDTSDKTSIGTLTTCNSAGAGYITSVEFIDEEKAIAGTHNGRILICDLTNPNEETNTEWYNIQGMEEETVKGLEYDGQFIHAISENHYVIMNYQLDTVEINQPPSIATFTVSDYNPDVGQDVVIDITPGGVEPEDVIKYGVKCEGTETTYTTNNIGSFTCNYNESGVYYARIAITDNYHYPSFYDERILQITVTEENFTGGIITVEVSDPVNDLYVVGAQVEADNQSANTNAFGRATITTTQPISYAVTITKTGYQTKVVSLEANGDVHYVQLIPTATTNQSALSVTVTDDADNPIEGALVSYTHTTTFDYDYTWTDSQGRAYFTQIDAGTVTLQASANSYDDVQQYVTIPVTGTVSVTIILPLLNEAYLGKLHADRDCIDNGVWLCGADNIVTHSCTEDNQCLSDYCTPGINRCSRFNYSVCDANDMARDQRCVAKFTAEGGLTGITNFMLTNLLWVIILLILLIALGLVFMSWNK